MLKNPLKQEFGGFFNAHSTKSCAKIGEIFLQSKKNGLLCSLKKQKVILTIKFLETCLTLHQE